MSDQTNTTIFSFKPEDSLLELPGLISLETRRQIEEIISCGFLPLVFLVGLVGNVLSLVVLVHQGTRKTANLLLVGVTVTDLLYIVTSFAFEMECLLRRFDPVFAIRMEVLTRYYLYFPAYIICRISALFICLVALERYIVIQFPFKANTLITTKRVMVSMVVTYLAGFALGGCLLNIYEVDGTFNVALNATVLKLSFSQYAYENFETLVLYTDVFLALVFRFLPVCFVLFCTCSILRVLKKNQSIRNEMTGSTDAKREEEQRKITKMLLSICILFIVCTIPGIVSQIARLIFGNEGFADVGRYENISAVVASVVFLLSLVNSSVNFVLYIATSKKLSAAFRKLFFCGRKNAAVKEESMWSTNCSEVSDSRTTVD